MSQKGPKPSQEGGKASSGPGKGEGTRVDFASTSTHVPPSSQPNALLGHSVSKGGILKNSQRVIDESDGGGRVLEGIPVQENTTQPTWVPNERDFPPLSALPSVLNLRIDPPQTLSKAARKKVRQRKNRNRKLSLFPTNGSAHILDDKPEIELLAQVNDALTARMVYRITPQDPTPEVKDNSKVSAAVIDQLPGGGVAVWFNDAIDCNRASETITEWLPVCGDLKGFSHSIPADIVVIHKVGTHWNIRDKNQVKDKLLDRNNWTEKDILKLEWVSKKIFKDRDVERAARRQMKPLNVVFSSMADVSLLTNQYEIFRNAITVSN
ncbi:hypothetical protein BT69DRAFT_1331737 [Atractiella rhizophila]|nr:hypothetical protein BT69DRAFT_1331737 [Atractiella rhizophila]